MARKTFSEAQIFTALKRAEQGSPIRDVCRDLGVTEQTFFRWRNKYQGMTASELAQAKELAKENACLKRLLAERDLEIDAMKEVLRKNW